MDLFRALGAGARFNKKRFSEDVALFEKPTPSLTEKNNTTNNVDELPHELDFFNNYSAKSKKVEKKGSKEKSEQIDEVEEEEIGPFESLEEAAQFRKTFKIKVYGDDIPNPFRSFPDLFKQHGLRPFLKKNLEQAGFKKPTPIQMQSVPIMLHNREIMACAPTGSGKTLAYVLPILHDLNGPEKVGYRALVIAPTRELAQQIYNVFKLMSAGKKFKICMLTKASLATQAHDAQLKQKFDILISTPLRLVHAIQQDQIKLNNVRHLILDEADKLLELGFLEQMDEIFASCTYTKLQKSLFSATIPSGVESLAKTVMKDPIRIVIGAKNAATDTIKQELVYVGEEEGKLIGIRQLVQKGIKPPVLVFVQSIERAKELFHELVYDGINVDVIHSERTKAQRDNIIDSFKAGRIWVLIATELMARGIDFKGVNLVINYDFPQSVQSYIHRIGRTGRAGRAGEAVTYFTKDDAPHLKSIVNVMRESGCDVPDWMLTVKNPSKNDKKNLKQRPINRKTINTMSGYDKQRINHKK
ncbi:RNA-dependent ATPase rok1 [Basidiobolus ranarum]|uniref:RNA helicase n=1 Tax=Basidiobolus ranarum TaxID=34480 RepID=A0ABR2WZF7_9FUNG